VRALIYEQSIPQKVNFNQRCSWHSLQDMRVTLRAGGQNFGTANWNILPVEGDVTSLRRADGLTTEIRRVDKIEDDPTGGKVVHLGGARPVFVYGR
jgi:hypothetical protein